MIKPYKLNQREVKEWHVLDFVLFTAIALARAEFGDSKLTSLVLELPLVTAAHSQGVVDLEDVRRKLHRLMMIDARLGIALAALSDDNSTHHNLLNALHRALVVIRNIAFEEHPAAHFTSVVDYIEAMPAMLTRGTTGSEEFEQRLAGLSRQEARFGPALDLWKTSQVTSNGSDGSFEVCVVYGVDDRSQAGADTNPVVVIGVFLSEEGAEREVQRLNSTTMEPITYHWKVTRYYPVARIGESETRASQ